MRVLGSTSYGSSNRHAHSFSIHRNQLPFPGSTALCGAEILLTDVAPVEIPRA
jgi:hypothetical protein